MKKILLSAVIAFFVASIPTKSNAESATDIIKYIASKVGDFTSKSTMQDKLCKKASLLGMKYSLRSLNGIACKEVKIAALALKLCKGYKDFDDSHCAQNANKIYSDIDSVSAVMIDAVKHDINLTGKVFCKLGQLIPAVGSVVGGTCLVAGF